MPGNSSNATLVYDGECSFCRLWVGYWKALTGEKVDYVPYRDALSAHPEISESDFRGAVHLFQGDRKTTGAEAVAELMAYAPGHAWLLWVFRNIPGVAAIAAWKYRFIAARRDLGYRVTRLLWGDSVRPSSYERSSALFARAISLIYLIAFVSFARQASALVGERGIQPMVDFLNEVGRQYGSSAKWVAPTLFWWIPTDFALQAIAWGGAVLAFAALISRPHTGGQKGAFAVLWIYYLSLVTVGQIFTGFQWDFLLLEVGFLAIFLKPVRPRVFLFHWLAFRLMFQSGAIKLLSNDPSWHNLTALSFHYFTQPLPTPLAWYAAQLPAWFQKLSTAVVFAIELPLPFLMLGPRRLKQIAAVGVILLQLLIILTGNYNFFNLLAIALCLFLFDDAFFNRWLPKREPKSPALRRRRPLPPVRANRYVTRTLITCLMVLSLVDTVEMFRIPVPSPLRFLASRASGFGITNSYGLFAVMTTSRNEISIEGSNDGASWQPYVFKHKPGPAGRAPTWVEPDQPRLDWQMWFAALGTWRDNPWLVRFMTRLLEGSPDVINLLADNPFPGGPPKYVRAVLYDYRFTTADERRQTGDWWVRQFKGEYFPAIALKKNAAPNAEAPDLNSGPPGAGQSNAR